MKSRGAFMKNTLKYFLGVILLFSVCAWSKASDILIVVDDEMIKDNEIKSAIDTYTDDIWNTYQVNATIVSFKSQKNGGKATDLKEILVSKKDSITGAIFVGDIPRAQFEFYQKTQEGFRYQRWVTDLYFMDLDGIWKDTAAGGPEAHGGKLFDTTTTTLNFDVRDGSPIPGKVPVDSFSIAYSGYIKSPVTALCSLQLTTDNDRRLWINDSLLIDAWFNNWDIPYYSAFQFKKDSLYKFKLNYAEEFGDAYLTLKWKCGNNASYTPIPDSVWRQNDKSTPGLNQTYYGNIFMKDSLPEEDIKHLWISGKSNGVFDGHYSKSGAVSDSFEIWVSRIDPNTAGFYGNPKTLLLNYFEKIHNYYLGLFKKATRSAMFLTEEGGLNNPLDQKFVDGLSLLYSPDSLDKSIADGQEYLDNIKSDKYDWALYGGHGGQTGLGNGLDITQVERNMCVSPRFFHFACCGPLTCYDFYGNANSASVGSEHIFNTINGGFVSIGSSKTSGSDQLDGFMYYAFEHKFIGESFREWVNERVKRNQYSHKEDLYDWFYGESIIGDPMQKLEMPEQKTIHIHKVKAQRMPQKNGKLYDLLGRIKGFFNIQ